jgi:hypothetical protein
MRKGRPHFVLREFAQSPEGNFPFIIVAHYQHAPLAGPVAGASTRKAHGARPDQRLGRPTATMMHWQLLTWPKEGRPPGSISTTMPRSADPAIMMVAQPTTDARHNRAPPH